MLVIFTRFTIYKCTSSEVSLVSLVSVSLLASYGPLFHNCLQCHTCQSLPITLDPLLLSSHLYNSLIGICRPSTARTSDHSGYNDDDKIHSEWFKPSCCHFILWFSTNTNQRPHFGKAISLCCSQ